MNSLSILGWLIFQQSLIYQQIKTTTAYFDKWTVSFYCSSIVFQNNPTERSVVLHSFTLSVTNKNISIYLVASMRCCFSQRNVLVLAPVTFSLTVEVNLKRMGGSHLKKEYRIEWGNKRLWVGNDSKRGDARSQVIIHCSENSTPTLSVCLPLLFHSLFVANGS